MLDIRNKKSIFYKLLCCACFLIILQAIAGCATKSAFTKSALSPDKVAKPQVFYREGNEVSKGSVLPTFIAQSIQGEVVSTTNLEGQVVLLNFWSIRCGPCIKEMPYLEMLYKEYKDLGLKIYSVNTDQATKAEIKEFFAGKNFTVTYDVLVDPDLVLSTVFTKWFVPVTILMDSKGVMQYNHTGFTKRDYKKYRKLIKKFIND